MRKLCRFLSVMLVVAVVSSTIGPMTPAIAASSTEDLKKEIEEKQKKISESVKNKKKLQETITDAKSVKKELEGLKKDVTAYITRLDNELELIAGQIEEYNKLIDEKTVEIEETSEELVVAIQNEENQYAAMKDQIKFMYEKGDTFYLDIMLNAKSFGDFLTKANYIEQLSAYNKKVMEDYTATREWTEVVKASLEAEKELLDEAKTAKESDEKVVEDLLAEKETQLAQYNKSISQKEAQIASAESELAEEVAVVEALEAQIKEAKKKLAESGKTIVYDGGVFAWPCPSYTRITDEFGWRTDPITGTSSYHSGLDMGAPAGSAILAAYDGQVVAATYNWSMGNYVMIDHGDGLYTVYMHASKLYVSSGQMVTKGETIAAVGTTGRSTGNHLHFGVRKDGTYVSPWNYLK